MRLAEPVSTESDNHPRTKRSRLTRVIYFPRIAGRYDPYRL